jgi:hypothetical protein
MRRFTLPVLFALLLTVISPPIHAEKVHGVQAIALAINLTNGSCVVSAQVDGVLYTTGLGDSNSNESASGNILFQCRADLTSAAPKKDWRSIAMDNLSPALAIIPSFLQTTGGLSSRRRGTLSTTVMPTR